MNLTAVRPLGKVVALVGRRTDPVDADVPRFPLENVAAVRRSLTSLFAENAVRNIVSSAACGADLVGLQVAMTLGIPLTIVLPYAPAVFASKSVIDRPGDWKAVYEEVLVYAARIGEVHVIPSQASDEDAYTATNVEILERAISLAAPEQPMVVLVWEGHSRGEGDSTDEMRRLAISRSIPTVEISTCLS